MVAELPFCGGWFLYLGYELAAEVEPVLSSLLHTPELPRATMTEIPAGIVRSRQTGEDFAFASGENAEELLELIIKDTKLLANNTANNSVIALLRKKKATLTCRALNR
jgi:anthranilate synthase component 1